MIGNTNRFSNSNLRFPSAADRGGQRLLRMGGSLNGYIRTGDPYHKDYYIGGNSRNKKRKRKSIIPDILQVGAIIGSLVIGAKVLKVVNIPKAIAGVKKLKGNFKISSLITKFKKIINPTKVKKFSFADIRKNLGKNLSNLSAKITNFFKKP